MFFRHFLPIVPLVSLLLVQPAPAEENPSAFTRLRQNNTGLVVDLGIGLWGRAYPVDYEGNGRLSLLVATPDVPANGIYLFTREDDTDPLAVFSPGRRLDRAMHNLSCSYVNGGWLLTDPGNAYPDFVNTQFQNPAPIPLKEVAISMTWHDRTHRLNHRRRLLRLENVAPHVHAGGAALDRPVG